MSPHRSAWHRTIRYAWASPATLVGLLLALLARFLRADIAVVDGVVEVIGTRRPFTRSPRWPFVAITLGHVIVARNAQMLDGCRAHERAHVRQYERWGVLFFPLYLGSSAFEFLRGRRPYWDNHFERQAREAAAQSLCRSEENAMRLLDDPPA